MSETIFVRSHLVIHSARNLITLLQLTGASGFLGSHIAIQLLEKGYRVRASVVSGPKLHSCADILVS